MKRLMTLAATLMLGLGMLTANAFAASDILKLQLKDGIVEIKLRPDVAPKHCLNMIGLAKVGFYNNLLFHRVIAGFVIQGGCPKGTGTGGPGYHVDAEFNDRKHEPGVLSMARPAPRQQPSF